MDTAQPNAVSMSESDSDNGPKRVSRCPAMRDASDRVHVATRTSDSRPDLRAAGSGRRATVHSCFRSALNIATPDGLLTIVSEAVGGLPNGIVADLGADFRALGIADGMTVDGDARRLDIPNADLRIDLSAAEIGRAHV